MFSPYWWWLVWVRLRSGGFVIQLHLWKTLPINSIKVSLQWAKQRCESVELSDKTGRPNFNWLQTSKTSMNPKKWKLVFEWRVLIEDLGICSAPKNSSKEQVQQTVHRSLPSISPNIIDTAVLCRVLCAYFKTMSNYALIYKSSQFCQWVGDDQQ